MAPPSRTSRTLQALALVTIGALLVGRAASPPAVVPATAPDTAFSAVRAMLHVRAIAQRPHPTGSADIERVRAYLVAELRALGLEPVVQDATGIGTRYRMAGRVRNVMARIPGTAGGGRAVMLVSHYDSEGASPGAGDAGSATAALLETARALRAGAPLLHDVIVLITDGEESGLLGAAAFAREHPWARDVELVLNFEARGTEGRSFMFETGAGNLDAARVLRTVDDVSATSLMVMVYRVLPNDTDLSELAVLGTPAMNFAFIDGVERYHTLHDDVAHLDPRSLQHHGVQALALARAFGNGPLPRPATGDAVFFDAPFLGLVVHPEPWALPIALVAAAVALLAVMRSRRQDPQWGRSAALGFGGAVVGTALGIAGAVALALGIGSLHAATGWGGAPEWRGVYSGAIAAFVAAIATGSWLTVRRWASASGAEAGVMLLWAVLAVVVTVGAPGASYVMVWPLLAASAGVLVVQHTRGTMVHAAARVAATAIVMVMLVPLTYLLGVALGTAPTGSAAAALLVGLGTWLVARHLEALVAPRTWSLPATALGASVVLLAIGAATVRPSDAYPTRANIVHQVDVEAGDANALPRAEVLSDSLVGGRRQVTFRVLAPARALSVRMQATAEVAAAAVGGVVVDTTRYRRRSTGGWDLSYVAPPDSGIVVSLVLPAAGPLQLDLTARIGEVPDAQRAASRRGGVHAVPSGEGDGTLVRRRSLLLAAGRAR